MCLLEIKAAIYYLGFYTLNAGV